MNGDELTSIEKLDVKLEKTIGILNSVYTDIKVIKNTCETRGNTCTDHFKGIEKKITAIEEDVDLTKLTVNPRLQVLESRDTNKEKFLYLVIGALCSGILSLGFFALTKLTS